jgi:hypothetical protein
VGIVTVGFEGGGCGDVGAQVGDRVLDCDMFGG